MAAALICTWVYYIFIDGHEIECRCLDLACMKDDIECQKKIHCPSYCMEVNNYNQSKSLEKYDRSN